MSALRVNAWCAKTKDSKGSKSDASFEQHVMSNSFGFGGTNASLVFKAPADS